MKTNCWLLLGTMLATSAVAQVNTNKLPEIPPPATSVAPVAPATPTAPAFAPAETKTNAVKKAAVHKKKTAKKAASKTAAKETDKKKSEAHAAAALPVALVPGPATVAADHANLRGQAGLKGEVVGHLQKGDAVNVISEITLDKPKAGEPAQWAKISLPASAKVWVDSKYIDATNKIVTAKKLNLRGGPGENYSVLGVIEKGASVTPVTTKENWTQIETPASAFAFVAANLLKQEAGAQPALPTVAATEPAPTQPTLPPPPVVPPTPTTVTETPTIAPPAAIPPPTPEVAQVPPPAPPVTPAPTPDNQVMNVPTPTPTLTPEEDTSEDTNLPPRIVTHEGTVRSAVSPVAPTYFELYDTNDNKAINYLYSPSTNLNLARYNGLHITVTGEEGLDPRWKDTPVLTIQKIYVLSGTPKPAPAPTNLKPVKKHWWQK